MTSDDLSRCYSDMFGGDLGLFFISCGDEGAPGEMVCPSEEPAGPLMDSGYSGLREDLIFNTCEVKVVLDVEVHILTGDALKMAFGDDSGRKGYSGSID